VTGVTRRCPCYSLAMPTTLLALVLLASTVDPRLEPALRLLAELLAD
jgi:hypothetical protein